MSGGVGSNRAKFEKEGEGKWLGSRVPQFGGGVGSNCAEFEKEEKGKWY